MFQAAATEEDKWHQHGRRVIAKLAHRRPVVLVLAYWMRNLSEACRCSGID
jgi:hypothetical protein